MTGKTYNLKIVVIGDSNVGKTTLVNRFTESLFLSEYKVTMGVDLAIKTLQDSNGNIIKLNIFDTGGQERFQRVLPIYYLNAAGVLICYDICDRESFENLDYWYNLVRKHCQNAVYLCVGTKKDLVEEREVEISTVKKWARKNDMELILTSSKDDHNVKETFELIAVKAIAKILETGKGIVDEDNQSEPELIGYK
jgi:small GTP-binding protein